MNKIIIFTDLDGTLLNEENFSFKQIIYGIKFGAAGSVRYRCLTFGLQERVLGLSGLIQHLFLARAIGV